MKPTLRSLTVRYFQTLPLIFLTFAIGQFGLAQTPNPNCCDSLSNNSSKSIKAIYFQYTGKSCNSNLNGQSGGKVTCENFDLHTDSAYLVVENESGQKTVWYSDTVLLGDVYIVSGDNNPDTTAMGNQLLLGNSLKISVYRIGVNPDSLDSDSLLQIVTFLTGCSQAIGAGDEFGADSITYLRFEDGTACGDMDYGVLDLGDAPSSYSTLIEDDGPRHNTTVNGPFLGVSAPDHESDGSPSDLGDGDDRDEDAIGTVSIIEDKNATLKVAYDNAVSGEKAYLTAWLDLNADGFFDETEKQSVVIDPGAVDTATLDFGNVPILADNIASTFARIRISSDSVSVELPTGLSPDGEVEDHFIIVQQAVFPVELADFRADLVDGKIEIKWLTLSETNSDHFKVQRSADGIDFSTFATVRAAGTTATATNYQTTDEDLSVPVLYYRLKQVDVDGSFQFSPVVEVSISLTGSEMKVFPNPVENELSLSLSNFENGISGIEIYSILGQVVFSKQFRTYPKNMTSENIDVSTLGAGVYLVKVNDRKNISLIQKFEIAR